MIGFAPDTKGTADSILPVYQTNKAIVEGSYSWRITKYNAAQITSVSDIDYTALALELTHFGKIYQIGIGGLYASDNGVGVSSTLSLNTPIGLSVVGTFRYLYDNKSSKENDVSNVNPLDMLQESQTNYSIIASYTFWKNTLSVGYNFDDYHSLDKEREYELSMNYSRPIFNKGSSSGSFSLNYTKSQLGYSILATINIGISGKIGENDLAVIFDRPVGVDKFRQGLNYKFGYDINEDTEISAGVIARREPSAKFQKLSEEIDTSYTVGVAYQPFKLQAQMVAQHLEDHSYGYLFNGTINGGWGGAYSYNNGVAMTSKMPYNSGALVRVDVPVDDAKFHVTIDDGDADTIEGNKNYLYSLEPYWHHKITISSAGEENFYKIDKYPSNILLYPSNVKPIIVSAKEFFVLITTIVDEQDEPIADASIKLGTEFDNNSDEFGEIQIEVTKGQKINVTYEEETKQCGFIVPDAESDGGVMMLDKIICKANIVGEDTGNDIDTVSTDNTKKEIASNMPQSSSGWNSVSEIWPNLKSQKSDNI
ncbi:MAG: hypothetical protein HRT87_05535 [Legionellales bacterium]|nr:hypothetical protein [Legionellales bacterium]